MHLGTIEICGIIATYARSFKKLGINTKSIVMFKNWAFVQEKYDAIGLDSTQHNFQAALREDNPLARLKLFGRIGCFGAGQFLRSLGRNNWFIFVFGSNFLPFHYSLPFLNFIDYAVLKRLGNVIVSIFVGCEVRNKVTSEYFNEKHGLNDICRECRRRETPCDPKRALRVIRGAERYSDLIITVPDLAFELHRPFYPFRMPIEVEQYRYHIPKNRIPRIIHAPSDRVIKGSGLIFEALDRLERGGTRFERVFLEKVSNLEVRNILAEGDILVDQVYSNLAAKLALEGMASGCAVLCGLNKEFNLIPEECPVIPIRPDPEDIRKKLKNLLDNPGIISELAERGRKYVEKYHESNGVVREIIHWIEDRPEEELIQPRR